MDKSWRRKPRHSLEYLHGVDNFITFAFSGISDDEKIVCPCKNCRNLLYQSRHIVRAHLVCNGMVEEYNVWFLHGEKYSVQGQNKSTSNNIQITSSDQVEDNNGMVKELSRDAFGVHDTPCFEKEDLNVENNKKDEDTDVDIAVNDVHHNSSENGVDKKTADLCKFLEEGNQELYPDSTSTVLSFTLELMQLKCSNSWTATSIDSLLEFMKRHYPKSRIPESYYEAKKMTRKLGLKYEKIHACPNNCMLYRGARAKQQSCHICKTSRWKKAESETEATKEKKEDNGKIGAKKEKKKDNGKNKTRKENKEVEGDNETKNNGEKKKKKVAAKILRYFPLIPRLQRLYMSSKTSSLMRWHAEGRVEDGILRHPADSLAWKNFDNLYPEFASDIRNVRLGLATDGFNASGNMTNPHSVWPIVLIIYNLPPWMCMKQSSFILSMIIPGKESPGDKIDIYLQPLIDELLKVWDGVPTYDATSRETFKLRATIIWTLTRDCINCR